MGSSVRWSGALPDAALLLGLLRSLRVAAEQASLLGQGALCDQLIALQLLDAVLQIVDLGFVDFERRRGRSCGGGRLRGARGFLAPGQPHDGDHEERQSDEKPGLDVLGQKTLRFGRFFLNLRGWGRLGHGCSSVRGNAARKAQFLFADGEVARVDDLGRDVHAVLDLERDQVRLAVFDFVQSGFFARGALDVGEGVVVVDGGDQEGLASPPWSRGDSRTGAWSRSWSGNGSPARRLGPRPRGFARSFGCGAFRVLSRMPATSPALT